jgi:hypothetical protein
MLYLATVCISLIFSLDFLRTIICFALIEESSESKFKSEGILEATLRNLVDSLLVLDISRDDCCFNELGDMLSWRRDFTEAIAFKSTLLVALCYTV